MLIMQNPLCCFSCISYNRVQKERDVMKNTILMEPNIYYTKQNLVLSNPPKNNYKITLCFYIMYYAIGSWMLLWGHCFSQQP